MKRTLNESEIVWLNSNNAAAGDGIYRAEWREKRRIIDYVRGGVLVVVGLMSFSVLLVSAIFTAEIVYYNPPHNIRSIEDLLNYLNNLGPLPLILGLSLFGLVLSIKLVMKIESGELIWHLIIPWSEVKTIVITNVRQVGWVHGWSSNVVDQQIYQEMVGDWHVFSKDGKEITIPNVSDPYNKLNYIKTRFNLQF